MRKSRLVAVLSILPAALSLISVTALAGAILDADPEVKASRSNCVLLMRQAGFDFSILEMGNSDVDFRMVRPYRGMQDNEASKPIEIFGSKGKFTLRPGVENCVSSSIDAGNDDDNIEVIISNRVTLGGMRSRSGTYELERADEQKLIKSCAEAKIKLISDIFARHVRPEKTNEGTGKGAGKSGTTTN